MKQSIILLNHLHAILKINRLLHISPKVCACGHSHNKLPHVHDYQKEEHHSGFKMESLWFDCQSSTCESTLMINVDKYEEKVLKHVG